MNRVFIFFLFCSGAVFAQDIKVEYDKNHDFTQYKTFRFGEGEVITPKDQRQVSDQTVHGWVRNAVAKELELRGLKQVDSAADLVVSYAVGTLARSDAGNLGPMGLTPGSTERTYMNDYTQGSLIIDLNDRQNLMVWRVNATTNMTATEGELLIQTIVQKGFQKFAKPVKQKKKKK